MVKSHIFTRTSDNELRAIHGIWNSVFYRWFQSTFGSWYLNRFGENPEKSSHFAWEKLSTPFRYLTYTSYSQLQLPLTRRHYISLASTITHSSPNENDEDDHHPRLSCSFVSIFARTNANAYDFIMEHKRAAATASQPASSALRRREVGGWVKKKLFTKWPWELSHRKWCHPHTVGPTHKYHRPRLIRGSSYLSTHHLPRDRVL